MPSVNELTTDKLNTIPAEFLPPIPSSVDRRGITYIKWISAIFLWQYALVGLAIVKFSKPAQQRGDGRIHWADGMRGLLAFSLILGHSSQVINEALVNHNMIPPPAAPTFQVNLGYSVVTCFMVLSGYVLTLPTIKRGMTLKSAWQFVFERRFARLAPAYYVAFAISIGLACFVSHTYDFVQVQAGDASFLGPLAFLQGCIGSTDQYNAPLYSIGAEMVLSFAFPTLLFVLRRMTPAWGTLAIIGAILFGFGRLQSIYWNLRLFPPFVLGMFTAWLLSIVNKEAIARHIEYITWVGYAIFFLIAAYFYHEQIDDLGIPALLFSFWLITLFAYLSWKPESRVRKLFETEFAQWFGKISYSHYLLHYPILAAIAYFIVRSSLPHPLFGPALIICGLIIVPPCAFISYWLLERPYLMRRARIKGQAILEPTPNDVVSMHISPVHADVS